MINSLTTKKIIYIGFIFKHHKGSHAGYNKIKNYLKYDKEINCQCEHEWLSYNKHVFFQKIIQKVYLFLFGTTYLVTLFRCIYLAIFHKNQVFHFIYGENNYKWLHIFKGKTNKIVCTFHQPLSFFISNPDFTSTLNSIDKIILMSEKDVSAFKKWTSKDNVFFIPHGIDVGFYYPYIYKKRSNTVLMVGNWLRDFEFANSVFKRLFEESDDIKVVVVTSSSNFAYFEQNSKLELLSGISDEELRDLYISAKCLFLPLKSFTANNAILEAAATCCPIIIATNNYDSSYFNLEQIESLPINIELVVKKLISTINSPYDEQKALNIRRLVVEKYSWENIANKTENLLMAD